MNGEEITGSLYEKELQKTNQKEFRIEEVFVINKIKNTVPCIYAISNLNGEEITGRFYEKELQKTSQKEFRKEKYLKQKVINYMSNGKGMIIVLIVGLIKMI